MIDTPTLTPTALPTPVGARDSFGEHFSVELDRVLTDWLADLDAQELHAHHARASI